MEKYLIKVTMLGTMVITIVTIMVVVIGLILLIKVIRSSRYKEENLTKEKTTQKEPITEIGVKIEVKLENSKVENSKVKRGKSWIRRHKFWIAFTLFWILVIVVSVLYKKGVIV